MMANYYEKLTKIFLMSGNALYHAAAWSRYYSTVISIGGKSEEDLGKLAAQVLVSALAVPVGLHTEPDELKGKNARLTALLGLTRMPTRSGLLKDAVSFYRLIVHFFSNIDLKLSRDVLKSSPESIKSLYNVLEVKFDPLTLCASIAPLLQNLSSDDAYSPYLTLLQRALLSRLLSQLSQVYSTIKISSLLELVTPLKNIGLEGSFDEEQVEAYIMGCARRGELNVRVDHKDGSITFVDDPFVNNDDTQSSTSASSSSSIAHEVSIQPSIADLVRTRLSKVALCLHDSLKTIEAKSNEPTVEEQAATFKNLVVAVESERKALQLRRALVARRRELLSELSVRKEKEESSRRAELSRKEKEEEERRMREDLKRKEVERTRKEFESIRADEAKKYAQSLVDKGILKPDDVDVSRVFSSTVNTSSCSFFSFLEIGNLRYRRSYYNPSCSA